MSIQPGTQVGSYQVQSLIGAGGMGEVYLARDTKLGRDVALKVLPELGGQDRDRISRFAREAQLLASLNHPNIAAIYGVEEPDGGLALVLEYVDGETLDDRINRGPIALKEALRIALQIAQALEAAHERNVIHRDLKPANIKLTGDGTVKVLDFGLAKALEGDAKTGTSPSISQSPTLSIGATNAGMILGTAGYMAPEQARGLPVDRRADIWAFGVVVYEMLSSRRVFAGETVADTLVKVLEREPDWSQLPATTPLALRKLLQRCLTKNPKDRLQAIGDGRTTLEELIADPEAQALTGRPAAAAYPLWKKALPWAAVPLALAAGFFLRPSATPPARDVLRFEIPMPPNSLLIHNYRRGVQLSPNGQQIAFASGTPRMIYTRNLGSWDNIAIAGTQNAMNPFYSPDGEWLGFLQGRQIKKVSLAGGVPITVVENLTNNGPDWGPAGIAWGKNGTIVFPESLGVGLSVVRDTGGDVQEFTTLDPENNESSHRHPHFLPDGSAVLFTVLRFTNITPDWKRAEVWAKPVNGERRRLLENAMDAQYAGNNTLIFARQAKLYAVRFDPKSLTVSGEPVQVLDGVIHALYGSGAVTWTGQAQYSVAENGTLVYGPGSIEPPQLSTLQKADRRGNLTAVTGTKPMFRFAARILPDGRRIAFSELHLNKDIWIFDPARGTEDRATYEGQNAFPIWSPDGAWMAFRSDRAGPLGIYAAPASDTRNVMQLTPGPMDVPSSWTADGKELAFTRGFSATGGNTDIFVVSMDPPHVMRPVVATPATESYPEFSPDGKWLAYTSTESGQPTIYVQPYPGPGPRVTVTSEGPPTEPAWSKNSNELFYRAGRQMFAVRFRVNGTEFIPDKPVFLFEQQSLGSGTTVRASYDVAPDGTFLFNPPNAETNMERTLKIFPAALRVILNWDQETERLLAGSRE